MNISKFAGFLVLLVLLGKPALAQRPGDPIRTPTTVKEQSRVSAAPAKAKAAAPQVSARAATRAALVPARVQLALRPASTAVIRGYTTDEIEEVRHEMVETLMELKLRNYDLLLTNSTTLGEAVLERKGTGSTDSEEGLREVLALGRKYINLDARYSEMSGRPNAEERRLAYLRSLRVDTAGNYSVNISDDSPRIPQSTSSSEYRADAPPPCHEESYTRYEKRLMTVGFDDKGNPIKRMDYDVVMHTKQVCN